MSGYRQFEIVQVKLDPTQGSEQKGSRPCVVLQTNAVSDVGRTTLVAPLTTHKTDKCYIYEVLIEPNDANGLKKESKIKLDQMRTIDKSRIKSSIGILENKYHNEVFGAIDILLDRLGDFR
jgi:mRNA interferase MazF